MNLNWATPAILIKKIFLTKVNWIALRSGGGLLLSVTGWGHPLVSLVMSLAEGEWQCHKINIPASRRNGPVYTLIHSNEFECSKLTEHSTEFLSTISFEVMGSSAMPIPWQTRVVYYKLAFPIFITVPSLNCMHFVSVSKASYKRRPWRHSQVCHASEIISVANK